MSGPEYDLIVVGYGPTGMTLAALAGRQGHRVLILERYDSLYNLPRAACFDDEIMRTFQKLGITAEIEPGTVVQPDYQWVNAEGEILVEITYDNPARGGWAALYMMYQPHVETVLDAHCRSIPSVEIRQGVTVSGLEQDAEGVQVTGNAADGSTFEVRGRYLVGADGGSSFVRRHLGAGSTDFGFEENWLVCDFEKREGFDEVPTFRQVCDPVQPISIVRIGPHHHRFSFMLDADETPERAVDPERVWHRVRDYLRPEDAMLVRVANYVFRSRSVDRWHHDRILLAGDAAHEMPPFLAQGMCSGMRDSHNLAWKLDLILGGHAAPSLLETYQPERAPHVRFITEKAIELGRVQTIRDPERARERDKRLLALREREQAPEKLVYPGFTVGLVGRGAGAGDVFPQGRVRRGDEEGRFDDLAGGGLCLLVRDRATLDAVGEVQLERWTELGGRIALLDGEHPAATTVEDTGGTYAPWLAERDAAAAVVRPDWYLFGTATDGSGLAALLAEFGAALHPEPAGRQGGGVTVTASA